MLFGNSSPLRKKMFFEARDFPSSLYTTISNGWNRAFAATSGFLHGITCNSDHVDADIEAHIPSHQSPKSDLPAAPLPIMELPENTSSYLKQKEMIAEHGAQVPQNKNSYEYGQQNIILKYPEARDIRPTMITNRPVFILPNTASSRSKRKVGKRLESRWSKQRAHRPGTSYQGADLDKHVPDLDKHVPSNDRYQPSTIQNGIHETASKEMSNHTNPKTRNPVHNGDANEEWRRRNREFVRRRRMNWREYEKLRSMLPLPTSRCKRKREFNVFITMEEPENKIPRIAHYWVIRKTRPDGENNGALTHKDTIVLDWCQYESERSLWPRMSFKRKREMTLERFLEEPKQKARRIGDFKRPRSMENHVKRRKSSPS